MRWGLQEVTTGDTEIVSALRAAIEQRIGRKRFDLWFGSNTLLLPQGASLAVVAPSQFFLDWLRKNFKDDIEAASQQVLGRIVPLEFALAADEAPSGIPMVPPQCDEGCHTGDTDGVAGAPTAQANTASRTGTDSRPPSNRQSGTRPRSGEPTATHDAADMNAGESHCSSPSPSGTRPVARPPRWKASLDNFIVGPSNQLAFTSAQLALSTPGQYNPLFLWGEPGVGKTHLLEGIVERFRTQRRAGAVHLTAEGFTTDFLSALHGGGLPNFRHKHRGLDLLAIDDVQFFIGKRHTIAELLHTVDHAMRSGKQVILTADRNLASLEGFGPELASRLQAGLSCEIQPPELEVRQGIVAAYAAQLQLQLPEDICGYVAQQCPDNARQLQGAVKLLKVGSQARGAAVTLELAEELLGDLQRSGPGVRLQDIEHAVCDVLGIDTATLQAPGRKKDATHPRMLAMWLARKHTRSALSEIGRYFGKRSHSTVVSAQRRIERSVSQGESFQLGDRCWRMEEAIRLVEARLRRA